MTVWLSIDTSMNACGVGVRKSDGQLFEINERMDRGQSERLIPMVMDVLARAGLTLPDVDAYAVTTGPGTFTGLRVGLSTIRTLAQVSGKPAIGVDTFEALACGIDARPLCILIETKRTDYYTRLFENGALHEGVCMSPDDLRDFIKPDWVLAGDAVDRAKAETGCTNQTIALPAPKSVHIIALAEKALPNGPHALPEPHYLRDADVSISRRKFAKII